jgi:signal peptidase I
MQTFHLNKISKKLLDEGYSVKLTVGGISMFPYLLNQEQVNVEPVWDKSIQIGDILVFQFDDKWVAHRLIKIKGSRYITNGDFCIKKDAPLLHDEIIGRVIAVYRKNKVISLNSSKRKRLNYILAKISVFLPPMVWISSKINRVRKRFAGK